MNENKFDLDIMYEFVLDTIDYELLLKEVPQLFDYVPVVDTLKEDGVHLYFNTEKESQIFDAEFTDFIITAGMDNQDTLNDLGAKLYKIYDSYILLTP